ncbi:MAG: hypothetical protein F6K56_34965 [Moorea sp. SIO3G5]|nr:hypothetical protein [Moorena sp. SIO3G5]
MKNGVIVDWREPNVIRPDSRFPFPSWEGLGVGSDSLLPAPCSLKTQKFVPHPIANPCI